MARSFDVKARDKVVITGPGLNTPTTLSGAIDATKLGLWRHACKCGRIHDSDTRRLVGKLAKCGPIVEVLVIQCTLVTTVQRLRGLERSSAVNKLREGWPFNGGEE